MFLRYIYIYSTYLWSVSVEEITDLIVWCFSMTPLLCSTPFPFIEWRWHFYSELGYLEVFIVEVSWVHNTVLFHNEKHRLTWYNSMQYPRSHVVLYYEWNNFKFLKDKKLHLLKLSSNFSSYWLNTVGKKICFILPKHHFTTSLPHQWTFPGNPGKRVFCTSSGGSEFSST